MTGRVNRTFTLTLDPQRVLDRFAGHRPTTMEHELLDTGYEVDTSSCRPNQTRELDYEWK